MNEKIWRYKDIDQAEADRLAQAVGISGLLAKVFVSRGIVDEGYVKAFLAPDIQQLHDPFLMDGMEEAVERIEQAVKSSGEILLYGDYDVDGVVGVSILYDFLKLQGAKVQYYIPDRAEEGYGLTMPAAEELLRRLPSLVITVDCGITSVDEVDYLQKAGIDVIITDHHQCRELLPGARAVLNPHKPGCGYPFKELSGAGVVLKLIQAMGMGVASGFADEYIRYLDLAALATVADLVPLLGENRVITYLGLKAAAETENTGLKALIRESGLSGKALTVYGAGFGLAPRVNAAGRLGDAERGVRLFTTKDLMMAEALAKELDGENKQRQNTEDRILGEALKFVEREIDIEREKVLVISGEGWHQGVIGIVASRILEKYNRPCIVIAVEDGIGKGSGRSVKGFNMVQALEHCEKVLDRYGGHTMAAGLTIGADSIGDFRGIINAYADGVLSREDLLPRLRVDAFLAREDMTLQCADDLLKMAPFGVGNPGPVFAYEAFTIADIRELSGGRHIKLRLAAEGFQVEAVGFGMGYMAKELRIGGLVDAAFLPEVNRWNNMEQLQLNLRDLRLAR